MIKKIVVSIFVVVIGLLWTILLEANYFKFRKTELTSQIGEKVVIEYDEWGVPTINAPSM